MGSLSAQPRGQLMMGWMFPGWSFSDIAVVISNFYVLPSTFSHPSKFSFTSTLPPIFRKFPGISSEKNKSHGIPPLKISRGISAENFPIGTGKSNSTGKMSIFQRNFRQAKNAAKLPVIMAFPHFPPEFLANYWQIY
jgi:hypothetical protein